MDVMFVDQRSCGSSEKWSDNLPAEFKFSPTDKPEYVKDTSKISKQEAAD